MARDSTRPSGAVRAGAYAPAIALVAIAALVAGKLEAALQLSDPALILLTGVLLSAVVGGLGPSLVASVSGFLVYNYFFVEPRHTFSVDKPQDIVSLLVFLAVAVLTSNLMSRVRRQADDARRREAHTAALYEFTRELSGARGIDDLLPIITRRIATLFHARAVLLVPEAGRLEVRAAYPHDTVLPAREREAAAEAWADGCARAAAANADSGARWFHVSFASARGEAAVLSLDTGDGPHFLGVERLRLLDALSQQAALAIERCEIDVVREQKAKTEQVIEASEDAVLVLDAEGRVEEVNEVAATVLGIERAAILKRRFDELASEQPHYLRMREAIRDFRAHADGRSERFEITLFLRGREHHYVLRQTPFRLRETSPAGLIVVLQDVTYIRDQESRRENLVATLSHELRTPLTSLRMAVELIRARAGELSPETRRLIETIEEDTLRLQDVSQQLLDLARTRAMAIGVQRKPCDVHELMARMLRTFTPQAAEKGVEIDVSETHVSSLMGDETKLTWALSNLVANAIRYTPRGGTVRVETSARDHVVSISVADDGPGIPVDEQSRVFERYNQSASVGDIGSAGLGLAIVRDIVQAHGGRIHLRSAPGAGTRFTLELPTE